MTIARARKLTRMPATALVAALALLSGCGRTPQAQGAPAAADAPSVQIQAQVETLRAACVASMVNSVCRAANDTSSADRPPADTVFVAGVGPVDAKAYRAIRESGDAMCETVKSSCTAAWDGPACRTARSLWPVSPPSP